MSLKPKHDLADDAEVGRIMELSLKELIAECETRGEDPAEVVKEVDRVICEAKIEAYRRGMKLYV